MAVEEAGKLKIRSCTVAKSTEAGDLASVRMAAAGSRHNEGEQLPEGWIDLSTSTGQKQPGSAFIDGRRDAGIDKMLVEAKLSAIVPEKSADASIDLEVTTEAASASGGNKKAMFRVPAEDVKLILSLKRGNLPSIDYLDDLAELYTVEEIAERRRRHQSELEMFKKIDDDFEVYQRQVRDSIQNHGYFEVDYDYLEERKKINAWTKAQWAKIMEDVKVTVCAADADQATQGYIDYVDSDGDDDSEYDDEDSESEDED